MGASSNRVDPYPPPPGATRSSTYRVRINGRPVFVEAFATTSYARFAAGGPVRVEVDLLATDRPEAAGATGGVAVFPESRVTAWRATGDGLELHLPSPRAVVVRVDGREPLFLLADPPEAAPPAAGDGRVLDATRLGVDPTGALPATEALQAALDRAAALSGGATVLLPAGRYRTGTLRIGSDTTLYLAPGALLQGSDDPADYPLDPGTRESAGDASLPPDVRYLGRTMTFSRLLLVDRAQRVRIAGRGTIDGAGLRLRTIRNAAPNLLRVRESRGVVIEDVLFRDAAAWSLHLVASHEVALRNVKIVNHRTNLNTDGIDPDMSTDVAIDRAFVYTRDDAICVKATRNGGLAGDPARITATDCLVSSLDAALKVGTESEATSFSDIRFEDCHVFDSGRAMSVVVRDGATYDRVAFRRIEVGPGVRHLVEQVIGVRDPAAALGAIHDLSFEDVIAPAWTPPAGAWTWYAQFRPGRPGPDDPVPVFAGADEAHAVDGLRVRGLAVNGTPIRDAATARDAAGLTIGPYVRDVSFG